MTKKHKPHSGSLAFYPRKRAAKETPSFSTFPAVEGEEAKPLNFLGYKAGMVHLLAKDLHEKATSYNQDIIVPSTVIECPPLKVYGIRAYRKTAYGLKCVGDVLADKIDKSMLRKINSFKKKSKKTGKKESKKDGKETKEETKKEEGGEGKFTLEELEKRKEEIKELRLLVHTQPGLTGIGKKKPDLSEVALGGNLDSQLEFAKQKLGNEIRISEIFERGKFADVKAVDKGKGFTGPVKRFGIKMQRPKAKKRRIVGSIGPWNPSTVMWTVARAGQMGYQSRTEYNKRIVEVGEDSSFINPAGGFKNYGVIKNDFVLLAGSVPGPAKRAIALRLPIRPEPHERFHLGEIDYYSSAPEGVKNKAEEKAEVEVKEEKPVEEKEGKKSEEKEPKEEKSKEKVEGKKPEPKKEVVKKEGKEDKKAEKEKK